MSRIGKQPITVPAGVDVTIDDRHVVVKGPKGTLEHDLPKSADCLRTAGEDRRVLASPDVAQDDRFEPD